MVEFGEVCDLPGQVYDGGKPGVLTRCVVSLQVIARLVFHGAKASGESGLTYALQGGLNLLRLSQ